MANVSGLFAAAAGDLKKAPVAMQNVVFSKTDSRQELLDKIMIFLCERLSLEYSFFKGGFVLTKLIPGEARQTEDIDMSIASDTQYYNEVIPILNELGTSLLTAGVISEYSVKDSIGPTSSGGIKMKMADTGIAIGIDVGWHDVSWGVQSWDYDGFDCNRFEVERMLSDKISAMYSRKRFRRTKDIYDFYILTNNFNVDIPKLRSYIERRGTIEWQCDPFREDVLIEYGKAYDKLRVTTNNGELITKPQFDKLIARLRDFMNRYNDNVLWDCRDKEFKSV